MAEEVEHLKSQFINALGGPDNDQYFITNSKLPCLNLFKDLKALIKDRRIPALSTDDDDYDDQMKTLRDFRDKIQELDMLLADCQKLAKSRTWFIDPRNGARVGDISKRLADIKIELDNERISSIQAADILPVPAVVAYSIQQSDVQIVDNFRWSCRSKGSELIGFKEEVMTMEKMVFEELNEDKFRGIGIVGKKGIGKTALAQVIFNRKRVRNHFLPRIWVSLSKRESERENTKEEVVKRMLDALGVEDEVVEVAEQKGLAGLLFALQLQLWGKRYLIVLDDVWDDVQWYANLGSKLSEVSELANQLAYGFPKGHGGTVIVTGRDEQVVTKMVPKENIYTVLPLSDPEHVWVVFMESLKGAWLLKYKNEDREFNDEEEKIILESELLQRPNPEEFKGIGIFGENYKEAVVRHVFNKMQKEDFPFPGFRPAIWVSLSKQPSETEITDKQVVKKMLKELQFVEEVIKEAEEKSGLLSALQLQLHGKKFLIVLDDVWSKVQVTIQEGQFGSWLEEISRWGDAYGARLIVTSRQKEIAAEMVGKQYIYEHPHTFRTKEHAWWIYMDYPIKKRSDGVYENRRSDLEFLKDDVVKKSQGFPLAAKLVGQLMYDQLKKIDKTPVRPDVNLANSQTADTSGVIDAQPADDTHVSNATVLPQAEDTHVENRTVSSQADVTSETVSASAADVPPQDDGWTIVEANSASTAADVSPQADNSVRSGTISASAADISLANRVVSAPPADEPQTNNGTISLQAQGSLTNGVHTAAAPALANNGTASSSADDTETIATTATPTPPPIDATDSNGTL